MIPTRVLYRHSNSPVVIVTFLSPSPLVSRRACRRLIEWTDGQLQLMRRPALATATTAASGGTTDDSSSSCLQYGGVAWDAAAVRCRETGTILQWLSASNNDGEGDLKDENLINENQHSLLAIQNATTNNGGDEVLLSEARRRLWGALEPTTSRPMLLLSKWLGLNLKAKHFLGKRLLPVLELPTSPTTATYTSASSSLEYPKGLKEIVIPFDHDIAYRSGARG